jgi:cob(I)alamin adenosyltransferase
VKYFTRTGDKGYTALLSGERVPKYASRPEAFGTVDELTAALGLARATAQGERSREIILTVQRHLYVLMAELAAPPETAHHFQKTAAEDVLRLENWTEELGAQVSLPKEFVVSGDTLAGAALDLARTVTRRAERRVARMVHAEELQNTEVLRYLNRLSSLLFVLARHEDALGGVAHVTLAKDEKD